MCGALQVYPLNFQLLFLLPDITSCGRRQLFTLTSLLGFRISPLIPWCCCYVQGILWTPSFFFFFLVVSGFALVPACSTCCLDLRSLSMITPKYLMKRWEDISCSPIRSTIILIFFLLEMSFISVLCIYVCKYFFGTICSSNDKGECLHMRCRWVDHYSWTDIGYSI